MAEPVNLIYEQKAGTVNPFDAFLDAAGTALKDKHNRPSALSIPSSTGWLRWADTAIPQSNINTLGIAKEAIALWHPTTGIYHQGSFSTADIFFGFLPDFLKRKTDKSAPDLMHDSAFLHIHPMPKIERVLGRPVLHSFWLSPYDFIELLAQEDLRMIAAIDPNYRICMAIKSRNSPPIDGEAVAKRADKVLQRESGGLKSSYEYSALSMKISTTLFGPWSPYDVAFYYGKRSEDSFVARRLVAEIWDGGRVHLSWAHSDEEIRRDPRFSALKGIKLSTLFDS